MADKIINCYELDIKQDIPVEMEIMRSRNEKLENSNQTFKIILLSFGLAIILFAVYQSSRARIMEEDKY
jgi:hypothetical protein